MYSKADPELSQSVAGPQKRGMICKDYVTCRFCMLVIVLCACMHACVIIIASDEVVSEDATTGPRGRSLRGRPKRNIEEEVTVPPRRLRGRTKTDVGEDVYVS